MFVVQFFLWPPGHPLPSKVPRKTVRKIQSFMETQNRGNWKDHFLTSSQRKKNLIICSQNYFSLQIQLPTQNSLSVAEDYDRQTRIYCFLKSFVFSSKLKMLSSLLMKSFSYFTWTLLAGFLCQISATSTNCFCSVYHGGGGLIESLDRSSSCTIGHS